MISLFKRMGSTLVDSHMLLLRGLGNTLIIAIGGLAIGIILGTLVATIKVMPKNNLLTKILDKVVNVYVTVIRGTPLIVQLLIVHYVILRSVRIEPLVLEAVLIFGINSSAYVAEIMRAGIMAVDRGQMEAARSLGLGYAVAMFKIVLPQAIKNIIPTLGNEFISLLKETSVAGFISVMDLTEMVRSTISRNYDAISGYILLALIYLLLVIAFTYLLTRLERRLRASDKR